MLAFAGITTALFFGLSFFAAYMKREEIMLNWSKYRSDPLYMFSAPMFKPEEDPRSRFQFAADNFYDVLLASLYGIFMKFLEPVFKIFHLFMGSLTQSASGLFNIKAMLSKMFDKFNEMTDIFQRRFDLVFHQLRTTFIRLFDSMQKTFGVAVSSIYIAMANIKTVMSFIDLMITIIIVLLCILVIMMIFLWFVLWPVIPIIIMVVGIIAGTAFSDSMGGMAETFCFAPETRIATASGAIPISEIQIGTVLASGAKVLGTLSFRQSTSMFNLYGIHVSGSHIVYTNNIPMHVRDHADAKRSTIAYETVYCLMTSDRRIEVETRDGRQIFADWEELDETLLAMQGWNKTVFETLNPGIPYAIPSADSLHSEAVFSSGTQVATPIGFVCIETLTPGSEVLNGAGESIRLVGIVKIAESEIKSGICIHNNAYMSSAVWIEDPGTGIWSQSAGSENPQKQQWYSLVTDDGTFRINTLQGIRSVRDFTDVGSEGLESTYIWVLNELSKNLTSH